MLRRTVLTSVAALLTAAAQITRPPGQPPQPEQPDDGRLPNGKNQRDEIIKSEHEKSLQDAADMQRLCGELRLDLEKASAFVVSVQTIKKTEEIEKLAKRIRGRLKRS
jgi:hypothetical protein